MIKSDLIGICETFLRGNNELQLDGNTWLGNNRKALSKRAICGSGGSSLGTLYFLNTQSVSLTARYIMGITIRSELQPIYHYNMYIATYTPVTHPGGTSQ